MRPPTERVVVVVSHGAFQGGSHAPPPASAGGPPLTMPVYHVSYALLDAKTGSYLGGEAKTDPCVKE